MPFGSLNRSNVMVPLSDGDYGKSGPGGNSFGSYRDFFLSSVNINNNAWQVETGTRDTTKPIIVSPSGSVPQTDSHTDSDKSKYANDRAYA